MKAILWTCLSFSALAGVGCADGNACDPGMRRDRNFCLEETPPEGLGGMGGGTSGPPTPVEPSEVFGAVCTVDTEADVCGGDAPNCGLQPGADEGICTVFGCRTDAENVVCPIGWSCFALADACLPD